MPNILSTRSSVPIIHCMTYKQVEINMYRFPDHLLLKLFLKKRRSFQQEMKPCYFQIDNLKHCTGSWNLSANAQNIIQIITKWVFNYRIDHPVKWKLIHYKIVIHVAINSNGWMALLSLLYKVWLIIYLTGGCSG